MTSSWKLCRFQGATVRVHVLLPLIALAIALAAAVARGTAAAAAWSLGLATIAIALIALHELVQTALARRAGLAPRSVTLLPLGSEVEADGRLSPSDELRIALAGPATHALAGMVLLGVATALAATTSAHGAATFAEQAGRIAIALAVLNLLPAVPLDMGHALRALYAWRGVSEARAWPLRWSSRGTAIVLGALGMFAWMPLLFAGAWIWHRTHRAGAPEHRRPRTTRPFAAPSHDPWPVLRPAWSVRYVHYRAIR